MDVQIDSKKMDVVEWKLCENTGKCLNIDFLYKMSSEILSCYDLKVITHMLYENVNQLLDAPYFALAQYNENDETLDFWGIETNEEPLRTGKISINRGDLWSVHCFLERKELIFNSHPVDATKHFSKLLFKTPDNHRQSFIYLPLVSKQKCIGLITVQSFRPNAYDDKQIKILKSLSNFIALAVDNAVAFSKIEQQNYEIKEKTNLLEATVHNITEIVELRTAVIEQQKRELETLSIVAKETNNAIMLMDASGNVTWINDCFTKLYGYTYEQFIASRGSNILSTSFFDDIHSVLNQCIESKQPCEYRAYNIKYDGVGIWTQTTLTPILDNDGNIRNLVTVDSDITEIMEAKRIIQEQSIGIKNSIEYAGQIQRAILPSMQDIKKSFEKGFIIFKPCSQVSGDFYWHHNDGMRTWIIAADCTGHGVPAALMSILGISILKEISKQPHKANAAQILNKLRCILKETIHQHGENMFIVDGMDIALCLIDNDKTKMQFAGAYHPLVLIRNNVVTELKGDRLPVGDHVNDQKPFTLHTVDLLLGDKIYLFSDGFASQFGGKDNKKYMKAHFIKLLETSSSKPMESQKRILLSELNSWMKVGNTPQIDDILVIGIEV